MTTVTDNTQDNAAPTQQNPAPTPTEAVNSGSSNSAKTFTQEHMNAEIGKARKDARETAIADMLKELGLTSKDQLKSTIEEAQTLKQSQMTEAEKKQADLDKASKVIADLQAKLDQQTAMIREKDIQGAVKAAVTAIKANDFDAIYLWAEKHHAAALNAIVDEEGNVDTKALEKLLDAVKKDKPTYFTSPAGAHVPGSQSNANGRVVGLKPSIDISQLPKL